MYLFHVYSHSVSPFRCLPVIDSKQHIIFPTSKYIWIHKDISQQNPNNNTKRDGFGFMPQNGSNISNSLHVSSKHFLSAAKTAIMRGREHSTLRRKVGVYVSRRFRTEQVAGKTKSRDVEKIAPNGSV